MKLLIKENIGPSGSLNTDAFAAALLTYCNTPDRDTKRSPAQVLYARKLWDTIPCQPSDLWLRPEWVLTREARERALARRHVVEVLPYDAYTIRVDGSGRVTKRNRKFLRPIVPYSSVLRSHQPPTSITRDSQSLGTPTSCHTGYYNIAPTTADDLNIVSSSNNSGAPAAERARPHEIPAYDEGPDTSTPPSSPCGHPVQPGSPSYSTVQQ